MRSDRFEISDIVYPKKRGSDSRFLDTPVYRFMSFEALQEILLSRSICLLNTKYWEDTYENFLSKSEVIVGDTPFDLTSHQQRLFGSCWTKKRESDALWRIYSQHKCGVRVRSTIRKLALSLQQEFSKSFAWTVNIGEVRYLSVHNIVTYFEEFSEDEFVAAATNLFRDSMFMKRPEFKHEEEIRIILKVKTVPPIFSKVVPLSIDPKDAIEEITFDPRISADLYELFVSKLKLIDFDCLANKSDLYNQDRLKIRFKLSDDKFEIA